MTFLIHFPIVSALYSTPFSRMIKPLFSDDPRGPWELIWHRFLDIANAFHLEDRYILYVYGKGVILVHLRRTGFSEPDCQTPFVH